MKPSTRKGQSANGAIRVSSPVGRRRDVVPAAETSLSPRGGAKHRTLKKQILALLADAGADGLTIDELADKLEILKARVQSWFSGTGKRTREIEKVAPGRWRVKADSSGSGNRAVAQRLGKGARPS